MQGSLYKWPGLVKTKKERRSALNLTGRAATAVKETGRGCSL